MSTIEMIGSNKVKLTFSVSPERFEEGLRYSYNKNKGKLSVPGFRAGRAPRKVLEVRYGKEVFFDDAINFVLHDAYDAAVDEQDVDIVSKPEVDVENVSVEEGVTFTAEVFVKPAVEVTGYRDITYEKVDTEVTEEEIKARIDSDREKNARLLTITDRPVENGDTVVLDFEGFVDGIPFEGGKAENYELVIGSKRFIDTFEEQLIGLNTGESSEVNVTFPENYGNEALDGQSAVFAVTIKEIKLKELPEADDDFAQDVSEFETFDEYKEDIKKSLSEIKAHNAEHERENRVLKALVDKTEIDVPDVMIEDRIDSMIEDFSRQLRGQGLSVDMYLQYTGNTRESLRTSYRPGAEDYVKGRLILEEIAKKEGFEATQDEIEEEAGEIAAMYGIEKERLLSALQKNEKKGIALDIIVRKAMKLILENALEV